MEIMVSSSEIKIYKFNRTIQEEIVQNIENIVTRIRGNIVLARQKGIDINHVDRPFEYIRAEIIADCVEEIEREEKRFQVESVEVIGEPSLAKIKIKIIGEVVI
ncbi:hypothetical protein MWF98_04700 [Fusobacterium necrophorum]|uniref:Uncharacterized protein n=1 Tax=Fusobacterium necrophorum subsp. funduliforme Fnf 1007 TaxID=1161424 RepID=A0AAN4AUN6_9FUSO|nr:MULTISPECIES: hypothetical protein [Fusobacterium]AVQ16369.1 hypothetical protein C4N16_01960 [Fusobacterium gonidiaformans ATCC 25563]EFS28943.1 hypothetical protein FGAG_01264 [Fusobacterium gonidiaformans ATCC 25563]EJU19056.1 hypothetical protein HMPREF1127_1759 [Fusobacterium necrophorum subsp. funduliforme Fnf 1007]KYM51844.1 hypothetical protein A2U04_10970 [Fusobacterium necrophorum subsp. funduliforme]MDK4474631.1 hypothetical protein [Fusobacterium necrophorum]